MPYLVPDSVHEPLYAIVPYSNPWRWKSREKHTIRAIKHFQDSGAVIILVEVAFNRRDLAFANSGLDGQPSNYKDFKHKYIGLRTKDELWLKENQINIGVSCLPYDWQNVCWLDSDIYFIRPNWVGECIHKLQHYFFLQMFSHARDVGPNYEILPQNYPHADGPSFVKAWQDFSYISGEITYPSRVWPGLAWACTREAWDWVGGLIDFAIWGGGDWHMAHALVQKTKDMLRDDLHVNYKNLVYEWYDKCKINIRRNVGYMDGTIIHNWHGNKASRGYVLKHQILAELNFDPLKHLKRDYQGLYQLHDDGSDTYVNLRDKLRVIAKSRNEDSSETGLKPYLQGH